MRQRVFRLLQSLVRRLFKLEISLSPIPSSSRRESGALQDIFVPAVGLTMALDLSESLDSCYAANAVDEVIINFVKANLSSVDSFVDVGANQGFYSCLALKESKTVSVVALEPDPYSLSKFRRNLELNALDTDRIHILEIAVGESDGSADLMLNVAGNRAGSSLVVDQRQFTGLTDNQTVRVEVQTLVTVTRKFTLGSWMMKMDIEGMEYAALRAFLEESQVAQWPLYVIVEAFGRLIGEVGGSPIDLLITNGYRLVDHDSSNFCFARY